MLMPSCPVCLRVLFGIVFGVVLPEAVKCTAPEYGHREFRLCNVTLNWTTFTEPVLLRLPSVGLSWLGRPLHCYYTFTGATQHRISLRLQELRAGTFKESAKRCQDGYLKIWDGSRDPGRHLYPPSIFCGKYGDGGNDIDVLRISSGSRAEMEFFVGGATSRTSFQVEVSYIDLGNSSAIRLYPKQIRSNMEPVEDSASVCYWRIQMDRCQTDCPLLSPGYPGIYPPNTECCYHVISKNTNEIFQIKGSGLSRKPREFNLQRTCQTDYVELYEGERKQVGKKIGRFCGEYFPNITTATSHVMMYFVSGIALPPYRFTGFHLSVTAITKEWHKDGYQLPDTMCSWKFNATAGSVSSPEHWLPKKTLCQYGFYINTGYYLEIIIHVYGLEGNCKDYIQIVDGFNALPPICERSLKMSRETFVYNLTSSKVLVRYFINSGQMEAEQSRGFWLSYRQIQEPTYTSGVTESCENAQPVIDYVFNKGLRFLQPLSHVYVVVPCLVAISRCFN